MLIKPLREAVTRQQALAKQVFLRVLNRLTSGLQTQRCIGTTQIKNTQWAVCHIYHSGVRYVCLLNKPVMEKDSSPTTSHVHSSPSQTSNIAQVVNPDGFPLLRSSHYISHWARSKDSVESADWWVSQTYCINLFLHRAWLTTLRKHPALPESYFANSHLTNSLNRASTTLGRWLNFLLEEARHNLRSCDVHTCYCSEPTRRGFSSAEKREVLVSVGKKKKRARLSSCSF